MKLRKYELELLLISLDKSIKMTEYEKKRVKGETLDTAKGLIKDLKLVRGKIQDEIERLREEGVGQVLEESKVS